MKRLIVAALLVASTAFAQTEQDLLGWVAENRPKADAGQISQLEFYREMHRRIMAIPAEMYPLKLENLRWIGKRIDVLEDWEAGRITEEQARRRLMEADAEVQQADADRQRANAQLRQQAARQAAMQDEAARRAIALQMLQNSAARPIQPNLIDPNLFPGLRPQTTCTTQRIGNQLQTVCQ